MLHYKEDKDPVTAAPGLGSEWGSQAQEVDTKPKQNVRLFFFLSPIPKD